VTKKRRVRSKQARDDELEWALGVLLEATRTTTRNVDLMTVSRALEIARGRLGSQQAVSERLGLSAQMLRDFAAVEKLCRPVQKMYADKRLTSVDVAVKLSRLAPSEQQVLARERASGRLTSKEVRDVVSLRRRMPEMTIERAIQRVKASADIKAYVIILPLSSGGPSVSALRARFAKLVASGNIVSLKAQGRIATLTITVEGQKRLQAEAKRRGMTKRRLVEFALLEGPIE